jgi:hypothetical protein
MNDCSSVYGINLSFTDAIFQPVCFAHKTSSLCDHSDDACKPMTAHRSRRRVSGVGSEFLSLEDDNGGH